MKLIKDGKGAGATVGKASGKAISKERIAREFSKIMEEELSKKVVCMWKGSSTNRETMKDDLPESCKERGCTGEFDSEKEAVDFCELFINRADVIEEE